MEQAAEEKAGIDHEAIGAMLAKLFDHWCLTKPEQMATLGFSPAEAPLLADFLAGDDPGKLDTIERAGHLLGIHKALRCCSPRTPRWCGAGSTRATERLIAGHRRPSFSKTDWVGCLRCRRIWRGEVGR